MPDDARGDAAARRMRLTTSASLWIGVLLLVAVALYLRQPGSAPPEARPSDQPAAGEDSSSLPGAADDADHPPAPDDDAPRDGAARPDEALADPARIENVTIRDLDGRAEFHGTVDLGPTLERIERGDRLRFAHDGSTFANRERRLPHKPAGYYHEYVHPTPGISGPGPQRVIVGRQGEVYYTFDHYQSFRRIK